ncbi:MAG: hypothetical protein ACRDGM_02660 [bacterium]
MRLTLCIVLILFSTVAHGGTFFNPIGAPAIAERGAAAAASLNEALSSLHLMYAAIERKDVAAFQKNREIALTQLGSTSERFRSLENDMPNRELRLNPKTDAEKEMIDNLFKYTLARYKIPQLRTERDLVHVAVVIVDLLRSRLGKNDIKPGSDDWQPVREVIRLELDLTGAGLAASLIFSAQK